MKQQVLALTVAVIALTGCTVDRSAIRVICGIAEVLLEENVASEISMAFGSDSLGEAACRLFVEQNAPGDAQPIVIVEPGSKTVTAVLPDGTIVSAIVVAAK